MDVKKKSMIAAPLPTSVHSGKHPRSIKVLVVTANLNSVTVNHPFLMFLSGSAK